MLAFIGSFNSCLRTAGREFLAAATLIRQASLWLVGIPCVIYFSQDYQLNAIIGAMIATEGVILIFYVGQLLYVPEKIKIN